MGSELIPFSKNIGEADSNEAELMTVREAFNLFLLSPWANDRNLIIESDSKMVSWIEKPLTAPWRLKRLINHIENVKLQVKGWKLARVSGIQTNCGWISGDEIRYLQL
ncbi:hypothetical protein DITRI_Ditri06bG0129200 [Diplodiscus trichospermus]